MAWGRYNFEYRPYVTVEERRLKAAKMAKKMAKKGEKLSPVEIKGRTIARTFWGKAWCEHLESFSDYENRLPRGRTYARNGSVIDLQIEIQQVKAMVMGSELYHIKIDIKPLPKAKWQKIKKQCSGNINSMLDLLQGRLSESVMKVITDRDNGLFPKPDEISLDCSCPDWATLCKHVAAALYGIGARLDHQPELLFILRGIDHTELIDESLDETSFEMDKGGDVLADDALSDIFGIDMDVEKKPVRKVTKKKSVSSRKKQTVKKKVAKDSAKKKTVNKKTSTTKRSNTSTSIAKNNKKTSKLTIKKTAVSAIGKVRSKQTTRKTGAKRQLPKKAPGKKTIGK